MVKALGLMFIMYWLGIVQGAGMEGYNHYMHVLAIIGMLFLVLGIYQDSKFNRGGFKDGNRFIRD